MPIATKAAMPDLVKQWSCAFESRIDELLEPRCEVSAELVQAMRYSTLAPGKRLRPFLVERCYRLAGGSHAHIDRLCASVECLHVFTLIHDDLPAMDDSDLRRGRPSNHKVYGEGLAILAGDALLAYGIELASQESLEPTRSLSIVQELTAAIGWTGVIGGQAWDILGEDQPGDLARIRAIHERKTARLFQACCRCGAIAAGADQPVFNNLSAYGMELGLAFQIADDLLDVGGTAESVGKQTGIDAELQRQSYPQVVGIAESERLAAQAVERAIAALDSFGDQAEVLRQVARYAIQREK